MKKSKKSFSVLSEIDTSPIESEILTRIGSRPQSAAKLQSIVRGTDMAIELGLLRLIEQGQIVKIWTGSPARQRSWYALPSQAKSLDSVLAVIGQADVELTNFEVIRQRQQAETERQQSIGNAKANARMAAQRQREAEREQEAIALVESDWKRQSDLLNEQLRSTLGRRPSDQHSTIRQQHSEGLQSARKQFFRQELKRRLNREPSPELLAEVA